MRFSKTQKKEEILSHEEETIQPLPPVGLCRGAPFSALRLLGALGGQCPAGPGALLVHLEDSGGGAGRGPTLCPSPAPGRIRLAGGGQLSAGGAGVYCGADVLPHGGLPGGHEPAYPGHGAHRHPSPGPGGGLRQRKAAENRQRVQRSHRDLSGPPASRPGRGHCHPLRAAGAPLRL